MARSLEHKREYQKVYKAAIREKREANRPMSFEEIGQRLGISGRYALMIYTRAMAKMKEVSL